jgi:putative acetyltransferase
MANNIIIRPFRSSDTPALIKLFRDAVHTINSQHYSPEQIAVWAPAEIDTNRWQVSLEKNITFVAEVDSQIVGFADMTHEGYLDRLYVHKDYQGRWIALYLMRAIEQAARELGLSKITTHCSIIAKKPAERVGFVVIQEQTVIRNGVALTNYVMEKIL